MVEAGGVHQSEVVDYCHKNAAMTKSRQRKAKKHVLLFVVVVYFFVAVNSQWVAKLGRYRVRQGAPPSFHAAAALAPSVIRNKLRQLDNSAEGRLK